MTTAVYAHAAPKTLLSLDTSSVTVLHFTKAEPHLRGCSLRLHRPSRCGIRVCSMLRHYRCLLSLRSKLQQGTELV